MPQWLELGRERAEVRSEELNPIIRMDGPSIGSSPLLPKVYIQKLKSGAGGMY